MKLIQILGHPVTTIILFCLLLISGEQFGGFYLLYLMLALPHGAPYALLAVAGILSVLVGFQIRSPKRNALATGLSILGALLMIGSLFLFFGNDKAGYNRATFEQIFPMASFVIFGISILCFMINKLYFLINKDKRNSIRIVA